MSITMNKPRQTHTGRIINFALPFAPTTLREPSPPPKQDHPPDSDPEQTDYNTHYEEPESNVQPQPEPEQEGMQAVDNDIPILSRAQHKSSSGRRGILMLYPTMGDPMGPGYPYSQPDVFPEPPEMKPDVDFSSEPFDMDNRVVMGLTIARGGFDGDMGVGSWLL